MPKDGGNKEANAVDLLRQLIRRAERDGAHGEVAVAVRFKNGTILDVCERIDYAHSRDKA